MSYEVFVSVINYHDLLFYKIMLVINKYLTEIFQRLTQMLHYQRNLSFVI